jgi:hypothetical protein
MTETTPPTRPRVLFVCIENSNRSQMAEAFLFGTYKAQPADGHEGMTIGLEQVRDERRADRLHWMLLLPFLARPGAYPVNRRGPDVLGEEPSRTGSQAAREPAALP